MASRVERCLLRETSILIGILFICLPNCRSNPLQRQAITLKNGAYHGLLIAIAERVPKSNSVEIINNIQEYFRNASQVLHKATRERLYFGNVTILVPNSWGAGPYMYAGKAAFQHANVVIDDENPDYGSTPYTSRTRQECGVGGEYIHLTPSYILNADRDRLGDPGKVIVHNWGHFRWGLGDEYARPDRNEPRFYFRESLSPFLGPLIKPVRCSMGVKGSLKDIAQNNPCSSSGDTGLPNNNCYFVPYTRNQPATASLMFDTTLPSVYGFCDNSTDVYQRHNSDAPNEHNKMCNGRSAWEVMREHPDFNTGDVSKNNPYIEPTFSIVQRPSAVVFVLDVSSSMGTKDFGNITRLEKLRSDITQCLRNVVVDDTFVSIIQYSSSASTLSDLVSINQNRENLIRTLPSQYGGTTCIGCGLLKGLQVLENVGRVMGGTIILVSGGKDTHPGEFVAGFDAVIEKGVVVDSILYSDEADSRLVSVSRSTFGSVYFDPNTDDSTGLLQALLDITSKRQQLDFWNYPIPIFLDSLHIYGRLGTTFTFYIDNTIGNFTQLSLSYPKTVDSTDILMSVETSSGRSYDSRDSNIVSVDGVARIINLILPGITPVGPCKVYIQNDWTSDIRVQVLVLSRRLSTSVDPITVEASIEQDAKDTDDGPSISVKVIAKVTRGHAPVLGANVAAHISSSIGSVAPIQLKDNGAVPDEVKGDGVYCGYFDNWVAGGNYSIRVIVSNEHPTPFNRSTSGGFFSANTAAISHKTTPKPLTVTPTTTRNQPNSSSSTSAMTHRPTAGVHSTLLTSGHTRSSTATQSTATTRNQPNTSDLATAMTPKPTASVQSTLLTSGHTRSSTATQSTATTRNQANTSDFASALTPKPTAGVHSTVTQQPPGHTSTYASSHSTDLNTNGTTPELQTARVSDKVVIGSSLGVLFLVIIVVVAVIVTVRVRAGNRSRDTASIHGKRQPEIPTYVNFSPFSEAVDDQSKAHVDKEGFDIEEGIIYQGFAAGRKA